MHHQKFRAPFRLKKAITSSWTDAQRPAANAGARLDVVHVVTETITLTRTFGMVPASREDIVPPAVLERVVVAANAFVRAGASMDPALLEGTTLMAVKRFYDTARTVPWLDSALQATRLRERAWRCASHVAYYTLQEHQRLCTVIPAIVSAMQGISLSTIRENTYPSKVLLDAARDRLADAGLPGQAWPGQAGQACPAMLAPSPSLSAHTVFCQWCRLWKTHQDGLFHYMDVKGMNRTNTFNEQLFSRLRRDVVKAHRVAHEAHSIFTRGTYYVKSRERKSDVWVKNVLESYDARAFEALKMPLVERIGERTATYRNSPIVTGAVRIVADNIRNKSWEG